MSADDRGFDSVSAFRHVDACLDQVFDRLQRSQQPVWAAIQEYGRTLVTISSGAIVFSVSVTQYVQGIGGVTAHEWMIKASWILLLVSLIAAILRQSRSAGAQCTRARFEPMRGQLCEFISSIESANTAETLIEGKINQLVAEAEEPVREAIRDHDRFLVVSALSLFGGLVFLVLFAAINI